MMDLIISLFFYLLLGFSYLGWGVISSRILRFKASLAPDIFTIIWIGWAITLFLFQVLQVIVPLTVYVVVPIFVIGLFFSYQFIAKKLPLWFKSQPGSLCFFCSVCFMLIFASWIALRSMLPPENYDSGLYHLNAIRWLNSYPIVLGLGNLAARLAFNQSFFLYVAALNFYPFWGHGQSIANSFLFLLSFLTLIYYVNPVLKQPSLLLQSHPFEFLPGICGISILVFLAFESNGLASPTPDLTSTLLQLIMFVVLTRSIHDWRNGNPDQAYSATLLVILASTSITIKLSNLAFACLIMAFVWAYSWKRSKQSLLAIIWVSLPFVLVMAVWCLRGYMLSGVPFFPSLLGYIPFEWAVPKDEITNWANWVYSWARMPNTHWSNVLGNQNWIKPWSIRAALDVLHFSYPVLYSVILLISAFTLQIKKKVKINFLDGSILGLVSFSICFWFFTAPDLRFANAVFFLLMVSSMLVFLSGIQPNIGKRGYLTLLFVTMSLGNIHYIVYDIDYWKTLGKISFSGYQPNPVAPLDKTVTQSGLIVYTPIPGNDKCWDAPLPCTPNLDPTLGLRTPGDLSSGFVVKRK